MHISVKNAWLICNIVSPVAMHKVMFYAILPKLLAIMIPIVTKIKEKLAFH